MLATALVLILAAGSGVPVPPGVKAGRYVTGDLEAPAPGPQWYLQNGIPDAPSLRAAYVFPRKPEQIAQRTTANRSSLITFGIEPEPLPADPQGYLQNTLETLKEPPMSFKTRRTASLTVRGMNGARAEYSDRDGIRQFTQVVLKMPSGAMLVVTLQSPDALLFGEDLPVFLKFVDGMQAKSVEGPKKAP